ncbi:MAG: monofunctional biosynthetic peptidoglycan transglycosylase [Bauldia sp.]
MAAVGETSGRTRRSRKGRRRPLWRRILRWALLAVLILVAIPLLLTPLYRIVAPTSTLMLWDRVTFQPVDRQWVTLDDVAPVLVRSVIASEDNFFCQHHGVDLGALREVIESGANRGASTIAMQTARNLFLWQGGGIFRKGLEIPIAFYADLVLGKRRLMEIYLNIAEWGPGIFGIEAAARHHFGVAASDLSGRQAALLAAVLPNPIVRDPANPSGTVRNLADIIQRRVANGPDVFCLGL